MSRLQTKLLMMTMLCVMCGVLGVVSGGPLSFGPCDTGPSNTCAYGCQPTYVEGEVLYYSLSTEATEVPYCKGLYSPIACDPRKSNQICKTEKYTDAACTQGKQIDGTQMPKCN